MRFSSKTLAGLVLFLLLIQTRALFSAPIDAEIDFSTTNGSTKASIYDNGNAEVSSVDSLGRATFNSVSASNLLQNTNTLQSGTTIYASSGTVAGPMTVDSNYRVSSVLDRNYSVATASNTGTLTTLYSVTIPANAMETDRTVRVRMNGEVGNKTGGNGTMSVRATLGGFEVLTSTLAFGSCAGNNITFDLQLFLSNINSASSQKGMYSMSMHCPTVGAPIPMAGSGTSSVDTSASAQTLAITVQMTTVSPNFWIEKDAAYANLE